MGPLLNWLRNPKSFWGRALLAISGGLLLALSFPAKNLALGAFLGLFLVLLSINKLGFFKALLLGLFSGFAFYGLVLIWLTTYLGPVPWFALCLIEAIFFAFFTAVTALVWRWIGSFDLGRSKTYLTALALGAIYVGREYVAGHYPFGGLSWARLGLSQVDNPLAKWAWAVDIAGFSWFIVFVVCVVTIKFLNPLPQGSGVLLRTKNWLPAFVLVGLFIVIPLSVELPKGTESGSLKVAAVQGNANAGLFAINPPGSILKKHLTVAKELLNNEAAKNIDLMVWPENSSDLDPISMVEPNAWISKFVDQDLKAPLLFGNKTFRGNDFFNEVDLWLPKTGLADWYDKKRPVPFGEYVPYRSFFMALAPDMIGLIGWDMSPGTRDGIFQVKGNTKVGSLICFEVTIDDLSYDLVDSGAKAIMIQTNSSDFGKSEQGVQLAAISRMRAIETGRTVVSISTVGVSGIYAPDGSVISELETFKPGAMVADIKLRSDKTPAMIFGRYIEPLAFALSLTLFAWAVVNTLIRKRKSKV